MPETSDKLGRHKGRSKGTRDLSPLDRYTSRYIILFVIGVILGLSVFTCLLMLIAYGISIFHTLSTGNAFPVTINPPWAPFVAPALAPLSGWLFIRLNRKIKVKNEKDSLDK